MATFHFFLTICAFSLLTVEGKTFTRCGLAVELVERGLSKAQINDWICLVENESARNTSAVGGPNSNGSYDYGLFQINGKWWCSLGEWGGDCNIKCKDLIDDDISDDVQCVHIIYARHGFYAWNGWKKRCLDKPKTDVSYCFNDE